MEAIHTEKYRGMTIKIIQDSDPQNPREDDNLGTMVCFHSRYNLGDKKHGFSDGDEVMKHIEDTKAIYLPLFLYDHSGITMSTGSFSAIDPGNWDSGQVGVIFITRENILKEYGWKKITKAREKKICEYLKAEVQTYDDFLTGNVYGFEIEDSTGESLDSCWGFFGDYNGYVLEQAKENARYFVRQKIKKHIEQVKVWIKNHVPLQNRTALVI